MQRFVFCLLCLFPAFVFAGDDWGGIPVPMKNDDIQELEKKVDNQQREINTLNYRFELMQKVIDQQHERLESMSLPAAIPSRPIEPQETSAQSWKRIEAESRLERMQGDIDALRGKEMDREFGIR